MTDYRTQSKYHKRLAVVFCALFLLTLTAFIWFHVEQGRADKNRKAERDSWIIRDAHLKSELKLRDSLISEERNKRALGESKFSEQQVRDKSEIERLKRKERASRANPTVITLSDTIYARYDTALVRAEEQSDRDSLSFETEIGILKQKEFKLDSTASARLDFMISQSVLLDEKDQKISRLQRLARTLGISTGVLAVLSILLIAL
jgi:hypothetical protein